MLATVSHKAGSQQSMIHLWPLFEDAPGKPAGRVGPPCVLAQGLPSLLDAWSSPKWSGAWSFAPDGRTLAISSTRGIVRLLETASGKERGRFAGHSENVEALSFCPDGRRLASGSRDTTLLVWDVTGRLQDGHLLTGDVFRGVIAQGACPGSVGAVRHPRVAAGVGGIDDRRSGSLPDARGAGCAGTPKSSGATIGLRSFCTPHSHLHFIERNGE
jgi:hypothetical protein